MAKKLDLLKASYICDFFHFDSKNIVESGIWTHALSDQNLNLAP